MSPRSPSTSPHQHAHPNPMQPELVQVDTALTVLSQINLLKESDALALDIGGSLAKLIYLQPVTSSNPSPPPLKIHQVDGSVATALSVAVPPLKGILHFFAFESRNIDQLLGFIRKHWVSNDHKSKSSHQHIRATGGGSYKYATKFSQQIGVTLSRLDEMACTVAGLNFLLTCIEDEVYIYNPPEKPLVRAQIEDSLPHTRRQFIGTNSNPFPYLLVNIGSGVSIVKVTGHDQFERVSGSSLGGGTFWGLARMLLDCATFDDVINLTHHGNNANVDMLVRDIYGGSYSSLGLDENVIAASFGKATMRGDYTRQQASTCSILKNRFKRAVSGTLDLWLSFWRVVPGVSSLLQFFGLDNGFSSSRAISTNIGGQYRPEDIALSLLRMVSYNIGQIAYLNARLHNLDRIYFGGNFIRNHPYTVADISFAVDFWSKGEMKALFLRHDGYLGAIGALIGASSAAPAKPMNRCKAASSTNSSKRNNKQSKIESNASTDITTNPSTISETNNITHDTKLTQDSTDGTSSSNSNFSNTTESSASTNVTPEKQNAHQIHTEKPATIGTNISAKSLVTGRKATNESSNYVSSLNEEVNPNGTSDKSLPQSEPSSSIEENSSKTEVSARKKKSKKKNKNVATTNEDTIAAADTSTESSSSKSFANGSSEDNNDEDEEGAWVTVRRKRRNVGKKKTS